MGVMYQHVLTFTVGRKIMLNDLVRNRETSVILKQLCRLSSKEQASHPPPSHTEIRE